MEDQLEESEEKEEDQEAIPFKLKPILVDLTQNYPQAVNTLNKQEIKTFENL